MQAVSFQEPYKNAENQSSDPLIILDNPEEWSAFSDLVNGEQASTWESHIAIEGMHCAACGFATEKALKSVDGVLNAEVNAASGRARIIWSDKKTRPSEWMSAIHKAGYRAFPYTGVEEHILKQKRLLMWRWLVAGFCMMQVMMYAYPLYIATPGDITSNAQSLLRWAGWVLTLPVMMFSCTPFFSSAFNDLKKRRISMDLPVAIGIMTTFMVSSAVTFETSDWWGHEVYFDSLTMFVFFLLTGRWLEARLRDKTAGALDSLMRRLPDSIERRNADKTFSRVAVRKLHIGDVVRVFPGEAFPADGKVIEGDTDADEALLTGESGPVPKSTGNRVIAGSHNLSATVCVELECVGASTQYAKIVALMERVALDKPRLAKLADQIAKPFLLVVLLAALASAIFYWQVDHGKALMVAVAVLIVTCPCALSLATPAAMLASAGAMARRGILTRHLQALEAMSQVDTLIFDKTGTLTKDHIHLAEISTVMPLSADKALQLVASIAQYSLHPVSRALFNAHQDQNLLAVSNVKEHSGSGLSATTLHGLIKLGSAEFCGIQPVNDSAMHVHMANQYGWLATFRLEEELRADAKFSITKLQHSGFEVLMLTGDSMLAAKLVADQLGIKRVFADCTPQKKLQHLQALQQQGRKVAMIGDGLNDGPVLAGAHVSVAMGQSVPLAQAQSDFVIQSGELALLPALISQARKTMRVVKQNLLWALVYNSACIPLAVLGYLPAWLAGLGMATSSIVVILNAARLARNNLAPLESS